MNLAKEVFPGVLSIQLPLPFELKSVNVFLVRLDVGYLLIDCGMETPESFDALQHGMASAAVEWSEIRQIVLTHMHPDHMGLSAKVLALTGAPLAMHRVEADHLRAVRSPELRAAWIGRAFNESGVPLPMQDIMHEHYLAIRHNFHALQPDALFSGGEEIPTALGPLQVLWAPGHSPGHVCLYAERHRLLFSGDQILPKITPNISWHPDRDTLADYLASLENLKTFDIDLILPSHGQPFSGHGVWIDKTVAHHYERCAEMRGLLQDQPRTAHALVPDLWRKRLSPVNHQFALLEVMAHLEFMRRRDQIRCDDAGPVVEWFAPSPG